ncbi:MAG: Omp28 family outer membrane lipoprotein [Prevotella sp.]|nr:Omp28 family outer membrane lipoprotein [Prevotella sp.]
MRWSLLIYIFFAALLLSACSQIDVSDRFIYVEPSDVTRAVLIEDFTGQRCVNCPTAASEIERLQKEYGEENVIAVGIHSGPLAVFSNAKAKGLRTELGDIYYRHWNIESEPSGLINRKHGIALVPQWAGQVYEDMQQQTSIELTMACRIMESGDVEVKGNSVALKNDFRGRLQLWVTEDSIVAPQMMPDGSMNNEYVHNHVLRAAINGAWGDEVNWTVGSEIAVEYSFRPEKDWNMDNLSVVAFVYNDGGVQQVVKSRVR